MRIALVSSRSFGKLVPLGDTILAKGGFEVRRIDPKERPLDEAKMVRIIAQEDPHAVICGPEPITANVLQASKALRMVMMHGVGVDTIDLDAATHMGVVVANVPGASASAVADLTIGTMVAILRHLCEANQATKAGRWDRILGHDIGEMTVGIIGTGQIGTQVIKRLTGFGSRILAYDIVHNDKLVSAWEIEYVPLETLLAESDIVTLHVPLTEQTRKMIGRPQLEQMKKTVLLINTARGGLVDEDALYGHLRANRKATAALDVFETEPPQDSPLLHLDNVFATPHLASYTIESTERIDRVCAETILNTFGGKKPPNVINPTTLDSFRP